MAKQSNLQNLSALAKRLFDLEKRIEVRENASLGEVLNVQTSDFGAVGDGLADDTAAIQDAIDSARNGDKVFLPVGKYLISHELLIQDKSIYFMGSWVSVDNANTTTKDAGSVLYLKDNSNANMVKILGTNSTRLGNVRVSNLVFQGNKSNNTTGHGVMIDSARNCVVENCRFKRIAQDGVSSAATNGSPNVNSIRFNEFLYCGRHGVNGTSLGDSFIYGNSIGVPTSQGITVSGGIQIQGNHVYLAGGIGIAGAGDRIQIVNNKVNNCTGDGIRITTSTNAVIVGNVSFDNSQTGTGYGLRISGVCTDVSVGFCCLYDDQGSPTQDYGLLVDNAASTGTIGGVVGSGNVTGLISLGGSAIVVLT